MVIASLLCHNCFLFGYFYTWIPRYLDSWILGDLRHNCVIIAARLCHNSVVIASLLCRNYIIFGYFDTSILLYLDTWIPWYLETCVIIVSYLLRDCVIIASWLRHYCVVIASYLDTLTLLYLETLHHKFGKIASLLGHNCVILEYFFTWILLDL